MVQCIYSLIRLSACTGIYILQSHNGGHVLLPCDVVFSCDKLKNETIDRPNQIKRRRKKNKEYHAWNHNLIRARVDRTAKRDRLLEDTFLLIATYSRCHSPFFFS